MKNNANSHCLNGHTTVDKTLQCFRVQGVRGPEEDVERPEAGGVQGEDREVRAGGERRQHPGGQRGPPHRQPGETDGQTSRDQDQWELSGAGHLHRGDPGGLHHGPGREDQALRQTSLHQRNRRPTLQDLSGFGSDQGVFLQCEIPSPRQDLKLPQRGEVV